MEIIKSSSDPAIQALAMGLSGKDADMLTKVYASILVKKQPFLGIPIPSFDRLKKLIDCADLAGYYAYEGGYSICAFYKHDTYFPIARSYYIKVNSESDCIVICQSLTKDGKMLEQISDVTIRNFIEHDGYEIRVKEFLSQCKMKSKAFQGLFDGRKENTITDSGMYFSNNGGCLVCGENREQLISTTVSGDKGVLFAFDLCKKHGEECAKNHSNLDYFCSVFGQQPLFEKKELSREGVIHLVKNMLVNDLCCTIDKVTEDTITATRIKSQFKLVLRLTSEMDYGYMIFEPNHKEDVARFDSAKHHDVAYGPDHLHKNLKNKGDSPISSFTTGFPLLDKVIIKKVLEEKEWEYENS